MAKALLEFAGRVGLKALEKFEANKPKREARRAKREIRKKVRRGEPVTIEEMYLVSDETEPKFRTSTKAVVGGAPIAVGVYMKAVELLPWPGVVEFLTQPEVAAFVGVCIAGIIARLSKTAKNPGIL